MPRQTHEMVSPEEGRLQCFSAFEQPVERIAVRAKDIRTSSTVRATRSPCHLVLNTVRMQPAMQLSTGILKNFSHSRQPLRVWPSSKVLHKGLRALDQCQHIGCCLRREEFLARHDKIHRRSMGLDLELPSRYGSQPRGATRRQPSRPGHADFFLEHHLVRPHWLFPSV